jgi:hypothetical protein
MSSSSEDRYRRDLKWTVGLLVSAAGTGGLVGWGGGVVAAALAAVLAVALVVVLVAWCGPLVVDAYRRTRDEVDVTRRRGPSSDPEP